MKTTVKALTFIGSHTDALNPKLDEVAMVKQFVNSARIVDLQKTHYGSKEIVVFDPIPYNILTGECFAHMSDFENFATLTKLQIYKKELTGNNIELTFNPELTARDYQLPVIDKLVSIRPKEVLGLTLATGRGKTFTICKVMSILKKRFFIYIKAEYVEKWIKDVKYYFEITDEEICVIQGSVSLNAVLNGTDFSDIKIFIIGMQTFNVYIKHYLLGDNFPVPPEDFLEHIGADVMLVDEGHEHFENVYRTCMVLAPNRVFVLTATMYSIDERINRYMDKLIPLENRVTDGIVNAHATAIGVQYQTNLYRGFKSDSPFGYSHIAFEKSIRRKTYLTRDIFAMYTAFIERYYIKPYLPKDKLVLFFASKVMCEMFITHISNIYKDKRCSIYIQGYKFETVLSNDIIATTIGKMGSAIDVPNLTVVLQTVVVTSRTKNEQTIGRLRAMEGRELNYIFFNAFNIDSHKRNFRVRTAILERVSCGVKTMRYNRIIGG